MDQLAPPLGMGKNEMNEPGRVNAIAGPMAALAVTVVAAAFVGTVDVLPAFAALPLPAACAAFGLYALVQALEVYRYRTVPWRLAALAPAASLVLVADHALATGDAETWPFRLAAAAAVGVLYLSLLRLIRAASAALPTKEGPA